MLLAEKMQTECQPLLLFRQVYGSGEKDLQKKQATAQEPPNIRMEAPCSDDSLSSNTCMLNTYFAALGLHSRSEGTNQQVPSDRWPVSQGQNHPRINMYSQSG